MKTNLLPWQTDVDEHSGGWFVFRDCDGDEIGSGDGGYEEADARRIVACVNACAGIPTELVEQGLFHSVPESMHQEIKQQRDELLAALKEIANLPRERLLPYHRIADKAIAKADLTQ